MADRAPTLTDDEARVRRAHAQRLDVASRSDGSTVADVVAAVAGVQAQLQPAAALSVRARGGGITAADVEHARLVERSVVRTWCQRGTSHLLATDDVGWMLALLGPRFVRASRRRLAQLGLDEDPCSRASEVISDALAAWSGPPVGRAGAAWRALAGGLREVVLGGRPAWVPASSPPPPPHSASEPAVRLLPHFDTYLMGYRDRALTVDARFGRRVLPGGGWLHPTVVVDGRVLATWQLDRSRRSGHVGRTAHPATVTVEPFEPLPAAVVRELAAEAADVGRFLDIAIAPAVVK